jgi:prophage tail gpP-like protein
MTITIDDRKTRRKVEFFSNFKLNLKYDSLGSTFEFSFYFNPQNPDHLLFAQIGKYQLIRCEHNGKLILTGFILSQALNETSADELVSFGGYSVPGVLEDSNIPVSIYPLQSDGLSLKQIAEKILKPFQINMVIDPEVADLMNQTYEKTTAEPSQTVKDYLTVLATQKNIIISHTANGRVIFTRAKTDRKPIADFEEGLIGTSIGITFNGQGMHTPITVIKQADKKGGNAGQSTINNPYVPASTTAFRPKVIIQSSGDDNDTEKAAKNALAAELKNIGLTITTDRWDINGVMIEPNNIITVRSPKLNINKKTTFFIESVSYVGTPESTTATLGCVLPEVYNGKTPKNIFF